MKTNHQKIDRLTNRAAHDLETADAVIRGIRRLLTTYCFTLYSILLCIGFVLNYLKLYNCGEGLFFYLL